MRTNSSQFLDSGGRSSKLVTMLVPPHARSFAAMRAALTALTDELRRLKTAGVKTVAVADESVAALRRVIATRMAAAPNLPVAKRETTPPTPLAKPYEPPRDIPAAPCGRMSLTMPRT